MGTAEYIDSDIEEGRQAQEAEKKRRSSSSSKGSWREWDWGQNKRADEE